MDGGRLVVIDSVKSFVGARTDVYRTNEVHAVLARLASSPTLPLHRSGAILLGFPDTDSTPTSSWRKS